VTVPFSGAVLCGGRSSRMGSDKALLEVGGTPMARRVADALAGAGAGDVFAVGGDLPGLRALGLVAHPDALPGDGPLPATLTALEHAVTAVALVVSCDLLAPDAEAMAATVSALVEAPGALVAVPVDDEGEHQWTHAAWRSTAGPVLRAAWEAGARSLKRAAADVERVEVRGLPAEALRDADSPGDLPG
jgi:molybdopterin-guanine dinucleotide biosynthesis protein A